MNQTSWVNSCQSRYRCNPPQGYHFEEAHYPVSRALGGTETVRLWYPDHIVQGCLQTLELEYPCIDPRKIKREREVIQAVYPEHIDLYDRTVTWCQSFFAKLTDHSVATSASHLNKNQEGKSIHAVNMGKTLKGKRWWNNGVKHKRSVDCPGEGWVPGRFTGHRKRV